MTKSGSSLRSKVYQSIREEILSGDFQEGEELVEASLGEKMGVSRTPVREALRQLALEDLVEIIPNKGAFVKGIAAEDVEDIYLIRSKLEGLCARRAAKRAVKAELEAMEEAIYLSEFHAKKEITSRFMNRTPVFMNLCMNPVTAGCFLPYYRSIINMSRR